MLQAHDKVLLYTELSIFLIKSNRKLFSVGWFLFISKINEKKPFRIFTLVNHQYQCLNRYRVSCYFFLIPQIIIKLKTNKIGANETFSYTMHSNLKMTLCRNKIHFHMLLEGKSKKKNTLRRITHFPLISVS